MWEVVKFIITTPPVTPDWTINTVNANCRAYVAVFGSDENELYVGGYAKASDSRVNLMVSRITSTGQLSWHYSHN